MPRALLRIATAAFALLLTQCAEPEPTVRPLPPRPPAPCGELAARAPLNLPVTPPAGSAPLPDGWRTVVAPPTKIVVEQVAALGPTRAIAHGGGLLYRLAGDRWVLMSVPSGEVRAVAAGAGELWVLAAGSGDLAGRALILRAVASGALVEVARPPLGQKSRLRALAVVGARSIYIGGEAPALARIDGVGVTEIPVEDPIVTAIEPLSGDDAIIAVHSPRRSTVVRGGKPEFLREIPAGARLAVGGGNFFTVLGGGAYSQGYSDNTTQALTTPPEVAPDLFGAAPKRGPIIAYRGGGAAVWSFDRKMLVHSSEPDGARRYFNELLPPGWQPVGPPLPRDPIAILSTDPPLIAGRDGALSTITPGGMSDIATPVVDVAYPRALGVIPLLDGAVLLITERAVVRVDAHGPRPVRMNDEAQKWLAYAARDGESARPLLTAAYRGDEALIAHRGSPQSLWIRGLEAIILNLPSWPVGVARGAGGEWVALLGHGGVVRRSAGTPYAHQSAQSLATLRSPEVSHAVGAFLGSDGCVRLVDEKGSLTCADPSGLNQCGPVIPVEPARIYPIDGGLIIATQHITTEIVDESGHRKIPDLRSGDLIAYAGPASSPYALIESPRPKAPAEFEVVRLGARGWEHVATVPRPCVAQALAVAEGGALLVGCEDSALLVR